MPVLVGYVNLGQKSPRRRINGFCPPGHRAEKLLAGKFLQCHGSVDANLEKWCIGMRSAAISQQGIDARKVKQFAAGSSGAGVDERARIDVAAGEHAGEWCVDILEALELFEAAYVGVSGGQVGLALLVCAGLLIGFLRGDGVSLAKVLPAVSTDFCQLHLRDELLPRGLGLVPFLINLGGSALR